MTIGVDRAADAQRFHVTEKGVVLVTPDMLRKLPCPEEAHPWSPLPACRSSCCGTCTSRSTAMR